jgi:hypothetical protein
MIEIVHNSPLCRIEYTKIRNGFIPKKTNIVIFKIFKTNKEVKYMEEIKKDALKFYKERQSNKDKFIQIYDLRETDYDTIYDDILFVKDYGNFLQSNVESIIKECCYGTSIIVNSEIIKTVANTCMLLYRHVSPTQIHTNIIDSYEWLGQNLKDG